MLPGRRHNQSSFTARSQELRREAAVWAITVIAALAGAFGGFLQRRGEELEDKR